MTDNEIIKAWKWHISPVHCNGMEIYSAVVECSRELAENTLSLINRQNAEIERLNIEFQSMRSAANSYKMPYETVKSEVIKEFAEKLKENIRNAIDTYYNSYGGGYYHAEDTIDDIDNLAKEMTEVEENDNKKSDC